MSFEHLNLIEPIQKALQAEGYIDPTPIQERSIPVILNGQDLLGCAQTGTGKTAAFAVPILQMLHHQNGAPQRQRPIRALVVTPTRELAIQIGESFDAYGRFTNLKNTVIFGGVPQNTQTAARRNSTCRQLHAVAGAQHCWQRQQTHQCYHRTHNKCRQFLSGTWRVSSNSNEFSQRSCGSK